MSKLIKTVNLTDESRSDLIQHLDFVEYHYENGTVIQQQYVDNSLIPEDPLEVRIESERNWRDASLSETDWIAPLTDHPQHAAYMTYRQELRDYPSQPDFPNGQRPVKP